LKIEDGQLFYISTGIKVGLIGLDKSYLMEQFLRLTQNEQVFLDTSDRIVMEEYINKYVDDTNFYWDLKHIARTAVEDCVKDFSKLKMYILVREDIGLGHSVNCVGHATNYAQRDWVNDDMYFRWAKYSRKKVTCKVTATQFEEFKKYEDHILVSESVLNGTEVVLIFKPREIWPEAFKRPRLYS
jgi:hypothetical protein